MKITNIKTFLVDANWRNWVLVKVETDEGIHGWGEASMEMNEDIAPEAAIRRMSDYFIDKDPRSIELHWHTVYRDTWYHPCYVIESALAAIEIALWDILGKSLNAPVYQLLGGACRPKVRAYANGWYSKAKSIDDYGKLAQDAASFGFKHIKIDAFWPSDLYGEPDEITRPKEIIRTVREAGARILTYLWKVMDASMPIGLSRLLVLLRNMLLISLKTRYLRKMLMSWRE